ncbi:MAG: D-glycerate dehydrogenase [bacterium]|nr:D-glycerate dehydrogenase [bacterium]
MKIYITRKIPETGIKMLQEKGYEVDINLKDKVLSKKELIKALDKKEYDAVLCLLTDKIDGDVFNAAPKAKIFANYAVGFDNIDLRAARERNIKVSNTPSVLTDAVAEHAVALILAMSRRVVEADKFTRAGKYHGWEPMMYLGNSIIGKTVGILGLGRIGAKVAQILANGFGAKIIYFDIKRNEEFEKEFKEGKVEYKENMEDALKESDFISIHLPLMESTRHILNKEKLSLMKKEAYLVNTSRGAVIDENALVKALKERVIKGAALDVYENEPALAKGLAKLDNVVLTPHIASATEEARSAMSKLAAENIIATFEGGEAPSLVA